MSRCLVHRCPHCKSDNVINLKKPEKSTLQKGFELVGAFAEGFYIGTNGTITETISNAFYDPSKHPQTSLHERRIISAL